MRNTARARTTVVFVIVLIAVVAMTPAAADELRWESEITYSANLDDGLLHLSSKTHLTALKPDSRSGNTITSYYFDAIEMYVPEYARNIKITSGSRDLDFTIEPVADLEERSRELAARLSALAGGGDRVAAERSRALVGGGSLPGFELDTWVVSLRAEMGADRFAGRLRLAAPPVLVRVSDGLVLFDMRTLLPGDEAALERVVGEVLGTHPR